MKVFNVFIVSSRPPRRIPILCVVIMVRPMACLLFKKGPCCVASAGVKPWVQMSLPPQLLTLWEPQAVLPCHEFTSV